MVRAVASRRRSPVDGPEWVSGEPTDTVDRFRYRLENLGFRLASINETCSSSTLPAGIEAEAKLLSTQLCELQDIDLGLLHWLEDIENEGFGPIQAERSALPDVCDTHRSASTPFANFNVAHLLLTCSGLRIIVSSSVDCICSKRPLAVSKLPKMRSSLPKSFNSSQRRGLALGILRRIPYSLKAEFGLLGSTRSLFGFAIAMNEMMHHPDELRDNTWVADIQAHLTGRRGIQYHYPPHGTCAPILR